MTRFMITLEQGVELVWHAFDDMDGGEIYVKKIPSMKVTDIARAVAPDAAEHEIVGIRPGEKLHEQMVSVEDSHHTYEYAEHYKILPAIHNWSSDAPSASRTARKVPPGLRLRLRQQPRVDDDRDALREWIDSQPRRGSASIERGYIPYGRQDITRGRHRRRGGGPALGLADPGPGGAAVRRRGRRAVRRCPCRRREQRHLGAAHRLRGSRARAGRSPVDEPDHLRRLRELRPLLRRRGRLRRYRPEDLQHGSVEALAAKLARAERAGTPAQGRRAGRTSPARPATCGRSTPSAERYGFRIIEDASHAIGARYLGEPIGNCRYSDITVFSFHPVKIITTAEGGMALTNDVDLANKMAPAQPRHHPRCDGRMERPSEGAWYYEQIELGCNYRMTDIQAALGKSQLQRASTTTSPAATRSPRRLP